tara:strand:+ start:624 stop:1343 length:720 start_codon:yes stop_codon:yes gene_type:complete
MKIFPAIDLKDGKCVRLTKGDFNKIKIYNEDPINQAEIFYNTGFKNLHIIDLDGALNGNLININIVKKIVDNYKMKIEVGGGIRIEDNVSKLIDIGVDKVILGTAAIKDKDFLKKVCNKYPNKIALSIDVRNKKIALSGWKDQTQIDSNDFLNSIKDHGLSRLIYTDINRDGTENGPNLKESYEVAKKFKIPLIISGGVSSIEDVKKIISEKKENVEGVIVGKAIYEKKIDLRKLKELE